MAVFFCFALNHNIYLFDGNSFIFDNYPTHFEDIKQIEQFSF